MIERFSTSSGGARMLEVFAHAVEHHDGVVDREPITDNPASTVRSELAGRSRTL